MKLRKKNERTRQKDGKKTKKKGTRASVAPPLISMHTEIKVACSMHAHTCMHALIKERKKNAHVPVTRWWIVQTFMHASIKERKKNLTCSSLIPNMLTKQLSTGSSYD